MARLENLAVMFVDMAGFAERTARQSREQNKRMMRDFNGLIIPLIARFGGRHVKSIGDAFLVAFRSPTDSVHCGMAMHDAIAAYNQGRDGTDPLQIRVAVNVGEVRLEAHDVFGEAVNIAARVEELTPPGEIYLTGVVYLSMNKAEVPAEHIGERLLKGIPEAVRLFRVPSHKLNRLTPAGESLTAAPGELPYGGWHLLPSDSSVIERLADSVRRAPYVDWNAKARSVSAQSTALGAIGVLLLAGVIGGTWWLASKPQGAAAVAASMPQPVVISSIKPQARAALTAAHTLYFDRKRLEAAAAYAKVLDMAPDLKHDSGLATNLVGTLGYAPESVSETIRKNLSPEIVYELGRRTSQPGRKGAQAAATLLTELGQAGRVDQRALALTELAESATCEDRLVAVKKLHALRDPRALPVLRESVKRTWFAQDKNACLRDEANRAIADLEKLLPTASSATSTQ